MTYSFFFDTPASFIIRKLAGNAFASHPEDQAGYDVAELNASWERLPTVQIQESRSPAPGKKEPNPESKPAQQSDSSALGVEEATCSTQQNDVIVVGWYSDTDPENPLNWTFWKKFRVYFTILYISVAVYMSGSIFTAAQEDVAHEFHISSTVSSLGLGLFVLGYGVGPMFLSPPSELPSVGRNIPYLVSMVIFLLISVPTALADNTAALLVLRFLQGFFGSPVLTTGGASLGDISSELSKPYAFYALAMFALAGPALGITIAGFSTPVLGWRWSLWLVLVATSPGLVLLLFLPETSHGNILLRRARRIRALSGREEYRSESEIKAARMPMIGRLYRSLITPWKLNLQDPSVAFTSIYCGLVYAIFYSFFEFFPLVYGNIYGMSQGEIGLIFISVIISVFMSGIYYSYFIHFVVNKATQAGTPLSPERRLLPALFASIMVPSGLFIFAWTARPGIHWIVPTIGSMLASGNVVVIIQCVFVYITMANPHYAASLFSGNGLLRCIVAFAGVLWSQPLYHSLGVAWGMTLMGGCCAVCIIGIFVLYFKGHVFRAHSSFTG